MTVDRNILPGMKPTRHSFRCGQPLGPGVAHHWPLSVIISPLYAVISSSPPVFTCCFRALLHLVQSVARPSQDVVSMSTAFISLTQTWAAGGSPPQCQLAVEDVFWNATILHTADTTTIEVCVVSAKYTYWEYRHETGRQRWILCLDRICPLYGG